ncbi:MAG: SLAP domain-containing protein [Lactobacillus sp.]|nr:SLAP domain-containing protein [Lactobacillus sp.]
MNFTKKIATLSLAALMGLTSLLATQPVQAAAPIASKLVMHTSIVYTHKGKNTGHKYHPYNFVKVNTTPITIKHRLYYQVADQQQYLRISNLDGVKRKLTRNAYFYKSSKHRTTNNGKRKLAKGQSITTYGASFKFKNDKRYFRVAYPNKYVKVANLSHIKRTNTRQIKPETIVTVNVHDALLRNTAGKVITTHVKIGTKFRVDWLESGARAEIGEEDGWDDQQPEMYHIKGTDYWIYSVDVKAAKDLETHDYDDENFSFITFPKNTDVYNADGTMQDHQGTQIIKQLGHLKVDRLTYIWVASEHKAELFYHLVGKTFYATGDQYKIVVGKHAYVKAKDVKFIKGSVQLIPDNSPKAAKLQAGKSN